MKAAVFSIGTEITRGELINSNAAWLSDQLTMLGCDVREHCSVADDIPTIVDAWDRLARSHALLVTTGGLGPTTDDLTAEAVAQALGVPLRSDGVTVERIKALWKQRGREMPASNLRQAELPVGATLFQNEVGTAPAFAVQHHGCHCFFLPGVPKEMRYFFGAAIAPVVEGQTDRTSEQLHFRTFGLPESEVADLLEGVEARFPGVTLGYRAHFPELEVKVFAAAEDRVAACALAEEAAAEVQTRLAGTIFGRRGDTYEGYVAGVLANAGVTLAVAESCTGGMVGEMLTRVPGASRFLLLDAVCYANAAKRAVLGVPAELLEQYGAVSEETAAAMAEGARQVSGADLAVSITGIAGPDGGTPSKPVGTVCFGLAQQGQQTITQRHQLVWDRQRIRVMASYLALRLVARAAL